MGVGQAAAVGAGPNDDEQRGDDESPRFWDERYTADGPGAPRGRGLGLQHSRFGIPPGAGGGVAASRSSRVDVYNKSSGAGGSSAGRPNPSTAAPAQRAVGIHHGRNRIRGGGGD